MESLSQVMFKFTNYVMMFAPIGVGAAMAHTIGTQGLSVLVNLGNLILTLYLGLFIFVFGVLGLVDPHLSRAAAAIHPRHSRAGHDRVCHHEQRVGVAESDAGDGAPRRAETHRRFCHADRLLI